MQAFRPHAELYYNTAFRSVKQPMISSSVKEKRSETVPAAIFTYIYKLLRN